MSLSPERLLRRWLVGTGFRARFLLAMMLVVVTITAAVVVVTRHNAETAQQANLEATFREQTRSLLALRSERLMAYTDKCCGLSRSVRIRAALEESDVEDLYRNALDELREVIDSPGSVSSAGTDTLPGANFFGFIDNQGHVLAPPDPAATGSFGATGLESFARQLIREDSRHGPPLSRGIGYLFVPSSSNDGTGVLDEVVISPIEDTARNEHLGALVLGFPAENLTFGLAGAGGGKHVGIWIGDRVHGLNLSPTFASALPGKLAQARRDQPESDHARVMSGDVPYLAFYQPLEVGAPFPPTAGVCLYSLLESQLEANALRWRIIGWGATALAVGFALSFLLSGHLSRPVERMAVAGAENLHGRRRAEAELLASNAQLERALAELQAAQAQVIQQERLRALGEMASGIAHDFNNALMPILGFSELLLGMPGIFNDREKTTNYLKTINRGARDAGNVVKRLREFYRQREEGEEFLPLNLAGLVAQTADLTQPKWKDQALARGAAVECRVSAQTVPTVLGNESDLREALTNLVFNAVDAMPNGGTLALTTRAEGEFAVLEVADTGTGMNEEVRRRCLEPFFSTKGEKGTGLGLSMVFGIIQRHGGTVEIDSREGEGSTFRIRLPRHRAPVLIAPLAVGVHSSRRLRILVVDDEPPVREILTHLLEGDGHEVVTASRAQEALERFQHDAFGLVITDMAMPKMSGEQLAAALKTLRPGLPVMLLTGFGAFMDPAKATGVDVIVNKPVTVEELRRGIGVALEACLVFPR